MAELSFEEALKAEYSEPAQETPPVGEDNLTPPIQTLPPDPLNPPQSVDGKSDNGTDWVGNPEYFQTGAKAGQKRQRRARQPLVSYEQREGDSVVGGELITGAMFISMIDLLFPAIIVTVNNFIVSDPKNQMRISDMQLGDDVITKLKPLAESTLRRIKLRGDPMVWLIITMGGMYAYRYAQVHFDRKLEAIKAEKEAAKTESNGKA